MEKLSKCPYFIYVIENKINNKKYIGQTNNFNKRMNGHRSDANNPNSRSYEYPLSNAIRKYGWNNFNNYIIEEIPAGVPFKYIDERERYFIAYYDSSVKSQGYNIRLGGQTTRREKLFYEEKLKLSNLFSAEEIIDIQNMLRSDTFTFGEIRDKYDKLTPSFLSNINTGINFKNEEWDYPLKKGIDKYSIYKKEEIKQIKEDIKANLTYKEISEKWNISISLISMINNGKCWRIGEETYPLCIKGCPRLHNLNTWVKSVQYDLMNSNLTLKKIAEKYEKAYSTIQKINSGSSHRNSNYKYPLTSNRT